MSKYTSGPWRETKGDGGIYGVGRPYKIATVGIGGKSSDEYHANISLIAAAPDMYEALKEMVAGIDAEYSHRVTDANFPKARAALAKVQP